MRQELPVRKKNRLENYNYELIGKYFVTVCVADRVCLLWEDLAEYGEYWAPSKYGIMVEEEIWQINQAYPHVHVDQYCMMPDHVHMIISIDMQTCRGELCSPADSPSLSRIVKQFKGRVTKRIGFSIWQKSFHDRIIRNEEEYLRICRYIEENPIKRLSGEVDGKTLTFLD